MIISTDTIILAYIPYWIEKKQLRENFKTVKMIVLNQV